MGVAALPRGAVGLYRPGVFDRWVSTGALSPQWERERRAYTQHTHTLRHAAIDPASQTPVYMFIYLSIYLYSIHTYIVACSTTTQHLKHLDIYLFIHVPTYLTKFIVYIYCSTQQSIRCLKNLCVRACVRVRARACVRMWACACVFARARVYVFVCASARMCVRERK